MKKYGLVSLLWLEYWVWRKKDEQKVNKTDQHRRQIAIAEEIDQYMGDMI